MVWGDWGARIPRQRTKPEEEAVVEEHKFLVDLELIEVSTQ